MTVWEAVVIECQESCVCLPTGRFRCVEVCPRGEVETPICTDLSDDLCCDIVESCITGNNLELLKAITVSVFYFS